MKLFLLPLLALTFTLVSTSSAQEAGDAVDFKQKNLSAMIEMSGGFNGKILVVDRDGTKHANCMIFSLTELVPDQNVITLEKLTSGLRSIWRPEDDGAYVERKMERHSVRVVHIPRNSIVSANAFLKKAQRQILKRRDVLAVYGTGNFNSYPHMDIFHPEDPYWGHPVEGIDPLRQTASANTYEVVETHFQSGHAIMVSYAIEKPATFEEFGSYVLDQEFFEKIGVEYLREMYQTADKYVRHPHLVRFGELKEYGFTVLLTGRNTACNEKKAAYPSASFANAHASVFAFYLFQLWDTTAEVVEVMQKTAIDIGEPGPDEEFGWGLINADHPIIWNKSIEKLQQSLSFCLLEDIALEDAITTVAKKGFDLFYDVNNSKREIGFTYDKSGATLALTTGSASNLFGLSSRFLEQQQNTFVQCGLRYSFTDNVSLIGIFGRNEQEDVRINKGSLGVSYQNHFADKGNLSLYAGYRTIWGTLGLPGYEAVSARKVPFNLRMPELRTSFDWSF